MLRKLFAKKVNKGSENGIVKGYKITWEQVAAGIGYDTFKTFSQAEKKKRELLKSDYIFNVKIDPIY